MARRKKFQDEHETHDRWLVSYADFITLLFAFFVVMYAVSSVNEGKYRVLSQSLGAAFAERPRSREPIQIGEVKRSSNPMEPELPLPVVEPAKRDDGGEALDRKLETETNPLKRVAEQLEEVLSPYIDQNLIAVKRQDLWIEIELKSGILFETGVAALAADSKPVLMKLAEILREIPNPLQVEGHTDNLPIQSLQFPSNWELSAARAASVVRQLAAYGVHPEKMAAIGYGEYQPLADNRFEEGRFKNRRVVLVLMSPGSARHKDVASERARLLATTPQIPPKPQ